MADFPAKAVPAMLWGDSRSEGAEGAAADVLSDQASSSSSKTRSSDINQESDEAAGMHEDFHGVSAQARTVEDAALQSQNHRVSARMIGVEGASAVDRQEEIVPADNMSGVTGDGDISEAAAADSSALSAASLLTLLKLMLLCGSGGPIASGSDRPAVEVTKGLVLYAAEAVKELFSTHREQIHLSCGVAARRAGGARLPRRRRVGHRADHHRVRAQGRRQGGQTRLGDEGPAADREGPRRREASRAAARGQAASGRCDREGADGRT